MNSYWRGFAFVLLDLFYLLRSEAQTLPTAGPIAHEGTINVPVIDQNKESSCPMAVERKSPYEFGGERHRTYSRAQLARFFSPATTIDQLLRNLKLALDHDFLLQEEFFEDQVVEKVFNTSSARLLKKSTVSVDHEKAISITFNSPVFPRMQFNLARRENVVGGECLNAAQYLARHLKALASLTIKIDSDPQFTIERVKQIFGEPSSEDMDSGEDSDGHGHTPTVKGWIRYTDIETVDHRLGKREGMSPLDKVTGEFIVALDHPEVSKILSEATRQRIEWLRRGITKSDLVAHISLLESER